MGILLLLKNGADINIKDNNGKTAFDLAVPGVGAADLIVKLSEIGTENITNQQILDYLVESLHVEYKKDFAVTSFFDYSLEEGLEGGLSYCFINEERYFTLSNSELHDLRHAILSNKDVSTIPTLSDKDAAKNFQNWFKYFNEAPSNNKNLFFHGEESRRLSRKLCINVLDSFIQMGIPTDKKFDDFLKEKPFQEKIAEQENIQEEKGPGTAINGLSLESVKGSNTQLP